MSFMVKNPLNLPEIIENPPTPPEGFRGIFPKGDGWYSIDNNNEVVRIANTIDVSTKQDIQSNDLQTNAKEIVTAINEVNDKWITINYSDIDSIVEPNTYRIKGDALGSYFDILSVSSFVNIGQGSITSTSQTIYSGNGYKTRITDGQDIQGWSAWKYISDDIGYLSQLKTTFQTNLVGSINELSDRFPIVNMTDLDSLTTVGVYKLYAHGGFSGDNYSLLTINQSVSLIDYSHITTQTIYDVNVRSRNKIETDTYWSEWKNATSDLAIALSKKVNVEVGKQLSTEDYTTEDMNKLANINILSNIVGIEDKFVTGVMLLTKDDNGYYLTGDNEESTHILCYSEDGYFAQSFVSQERFDSVVGDISTLLDVINGEVI